MDRKEAILRIKDHMEHHGIGKYPHLKLKEALDMAIAALSQPNEPMTLEQLREMDGEPVWVTPLGFWALVIAKPGKRVQLMSNDGETVWADKEIELVGPIYRRPPEGEADEWK